MTTKSVTSSATSSGIAWDRSTAPAGAARAYQRYLVPGLFRPSAEALLDAEPPRSGDRILDVGCGTGVVALLAAERLHGNASVAGIDVNPGMIEIARSLSGAERVEWRIGDAMALPYDDASLDLVYCHHTLQFVPDRVKALRETHRVLTPGGRLAVGVWGAVERKPCLRRPRRGADPSRLERGRGSGDGRPVRPVGCRAARGAHRRGRLR